MLPLANDYYTKMYGNILVIGDFNAEQDVPLIKSFIENHGLCNHVKSKRCWKSMNGTCIDLVLANKTFSLINTGTVETVLSDHHTLYLKSVFHT